MKIGLFLAAFVVIISLGSGLYFKGKKDCKVKYELKIAEINNEWNEKFINISREIGRLNAVLADKTKELEILSKKRKTKIKKYVEENSDSNNICLANEWVQFINKTQRN